MTPEEIKLIVDSFKDAANDSSGAIYILIAVLITALPIITRYIRKAFAKEVSNVATTIVNPIITLIETNNKEQKELSTALGMMIEELKYLHEKADEHDERIEKLESFKFRSRGKKQVA